MATLADRLNLLQKQQGKLKKDIAAFAGISLMAYYRYENGERNPPSDILISLADYFNVSIDYLVGRTDNPEINR